MDGRQAGGRLVVDDSNEDNGAGGAARGQCWNSQSPINNWKVNGGGGYHWLIVCCFSSFPGRESKVHRRRRRLLAAAAAASILLMVAQGKTN